MVGEVDRVDQKRVVCVLRSRHFLPCSALLGQELACHEIGLRAIQTDCVVRLQLVAIAVFLLLRLLIAAIVIVGFLVPSPVPVAGGGDFVLATVDDLSLTGRNEASNALLTASSFARLLHLFCCYRQTVSTNRVWNNLRYRLVGRIFNAF